MKFSRWLSRPEEKRDTTDEQFDPSMMMLADLMWSKITGKRTCMKTLLGITVHGMTRSKQLLTLLKELGLTISYILMFKIHMQPGPYRKPLGIQFVQRK